jgi:hypothetical protein
MDSRKLVRSPGLSANLFSFSKYKLAPDRCRRVCRPGAPYARPMPKLSRKVFAEFQSRLFEVTIIF